MSFSYQGHFRYMNLADELEGSITNTLGYNMMEMQARSQEALEVMMQQQQQQQQQELQPKEPPRPKLSKKERDERAAAYKRAQTNAQKIHNERIRRKNEELVSKAMVKEGKKPDGAKNVTIKEGVMPKAQVAKWKR